MARYADIKSVHAYQYYIPTAGVPSDKGVGTPGVGSAYLKLTLTLTLPNLPSGYLLAFAIRY